MTTEIVIGQKKVSGEDFFKFKSGKDFRFSNFKEIKEEDLKSADLKTKKLFNIFAGEDKILQKSEAQSLFNALKSASGINKTLEEKEIKEFTEAKIGEKIDKDLFKNFINQVFGVENKKSETNITDNKNNQEIQPSFDIELTAEQKRLLTIQNLKDDVKTAWRIFNTQNDNQGNISDFVNDYKEIFDTDFAKTRVNRYLMEEDLTTNLLERSSNNSLTIKDYLELKLKLALSMLPSLKDSALKGRISKNILTLGIYGGFDNKTKAEQEKIIKEREIELLKNALLRLTPEQINSFITKLASFSDEEYQAKVPIIAQNMIKQSLDIINVQNKNSSDKFSHKIKNGAISGSIEELLSTEESYKLMDFKEVFLKERGVEYSEEKILAYTTKEANLQFLVNMQNTNQYIKNILQKNTNTVSSNNSFGIADQKTGKRNITELATSLEIAFKILYSQKPTEAQKVIDEILGLNSGVKVLIDANGKFSRLQFEGIEHLSIKLEEEIDSSNAEGLIKIPVSAFLLVQLSEGLQNKLDNNLNKALNGKSLEQYSEEVKNAYSFAYGAKNAQKMAEAFSESQQEGVENVKAAVQGVSMLAMVAGQFIPVVGQSLTLGGLGIATAGGTSVSLLENSSKEGGITEEDKKAMLKELGTSVALMGTGFASGSFSSRVFDILKKYGLSKAWAAEVSTDVSLGLLSNYAITGQIDLSGEGIVQLQNILVGLIKSKGNLKTYIDTHSGEIGGKLQEETNTPQNEIPEIKPKEKVEAQLSDKTENNKKEYVVPRTKNIEMKLQEEISSSSNEVTKPSLFTRLKNKYKVRIYISEHYKSLTPEENANINLFLTKVLELDSNANLNDAKELIINHIKNCKNIPNKEHFMQNLAMLFNKNKNNNEFILKFHKVMSRINEVYDDKSKSNIIEMLAFSNNIDINQIDKLILEIDFKKVDKNSLLKIIEEKSKGYGSLTLLNNYQLLYPQKCELLCDITQKKLIDEIYILFKDMELSNSHLSTLDFKQLIQSLKDQIDNFKLEEYESYIGKNEYMEYNIEAPVFKEADASLFSKILELATHNNIGEKESLSDYFLRLNNIRLNEIQENKKNRKFQKQAIIESNYRDDTPPLDVITLTDKELKEYESNKDFYIQKAGDPGTHQGQMQSGAIYSKALQEYERYNSTEYFKEHPNEFMQIFKGYKYPPVIRQLLVKSPVHFIENGKDIMGFQSIPAIGKSYKVGKLKCCSASLVNSNEGSVAGNILVEIHPISEISKGHFVRGFGNEIRYGCNSEFKVIDKYYEIEESSFGRQIVGHVILQEK